MSRLRVVVVVVAAADWGAWSDWSPCLCSLVRVRTRECVVQPCLGDEAESQPCACVPTDPPSEYWLDQVQQHGKNVAKSRKVFRTSALTSLFTVRHAAGSFGGRC